MSVNLASLWTGLTRGLSARRNRIAKKARPARQPDASLQLEALEERAVFAVANIDLDFGSGGTVSTPGYTWNGQAVQGDGKIVLVGTHNNNGNNDIAVMRLNANGTIDNTFGGGDGIVTVGIGSANDVGNDVAIDNNGRIVIGGSTSANANSSQAVAIRLTTAGALDTTFSSDGIQTVNFGGSTSVANSVAVDSQNRVVLAGAVSGLTDRDAAIARLSTSGALDTSFSGDGIFTNNSGLLLDDEFTAVAVRAGDKIVAVGNSDLLGQVLGTVRVVGVNANGTLDTSYGNNGVTGIGLQLLGDAQAYDALLDSQGRLVVASSVVVGPLSLLVASRLDDSGDLDTTFGAGGTTTVDLSLTGLADVGIALNANDDVFLGGAGNGLLGIVQLDAVTGLVDTLLGGDGTSLLGGLGPNVVGGVLAITQDGITAITNGNGIGSITQLLTNLPLGLNLDNLLGGVNGGPLNIVEGVLNSGGLGSLPLAELLPTGLQPGQLIDYVLSGDDAGLFEIVNGVLTLVGDPVGGGPLDVVVSLIDQLTGDTLLTQPLQIIVENLAPVITNTLPELIGSLPVDALAGEATGVVVTAVDAVGSTLEYILNDDAGGLFDIDPLTGVITLAADAVGQLVEGVYNLVVGVTDGLTTTLQDVIINVLPPLVSTTPSVQVDGTADGDAAVDVDEGQPAGTPVAELSTTNFSPTATVTYTLLDSSSGQFRIVGTQLQTNAVLNHESGATRTVVVRVTDGTTTIDKTIIVTVNNVAPSAPVDSNSNVNTVAVGATAGTQVGITASSTDPAGGTIVYSLSNDAGGRFQINAQTGIVTVVQGAAFTVGQNPTITVRASDGSLSTTSDFIINVTAVPTSSYGLTVDGSIDGDAAVDVNEGAGTGTSIGTVTGTGFAPGANLTYTMVNNAGGQFSLSGNRIVTAGPVNFEGNAAVRTVVIRVSDGVNSYEQNVDITVNNLPPSNPIDVDSTTNRIAAGAAAGTATGLQVASTDPAGGTVTYSLANDAGGRFVIDPTTGIVRTGSTPTVAGENGATITVVATDAAGVTSSANFTIIVATQGGGSSTPGTVEPGTDPVDGAPALFIYGTNANDKITVYYKSGGYRVKMNGSYLGGTYNLPSNARIYIYGYDGNDKIKMSSKSVNSAYIFGGNGNDKLYGGRAADVILGEAGNDYIKGGGGRDVVIGGAGVDKIYGTGSGSSKFNEGNIEIGDSTDHDGDLAALQAISTVWSQNLNAANVETSIRSYFNADTVNADGVQDRIYFSSKGPDWAFAYEMVNGVRLDRFSSFRSTDRVN